MKRLGIVVAIVLLLAAGAVGLYLRYMAGAAMDPAFFASEIEAFIEADRARPPAPGQIVFVGSSSIRFWTTLAEDMAPLATVRRGFGGAHLSHVLYEAPRVILPYAPRAVVVYAGDNDIGAGKRAETVVADFEALVERIHASLPETDVWFLSIKPSRLRRALWPEMVKANEGIRARAERDPRVRYVDVGTSLLGTDGEPDRRFFRFDGLHLNAAGYAAWTAVVRPALLAAYGPSEANPR
jgi:lysophospholipase L1-like esterase